MFIYIYISVARSFITGVSSLIQAKRLRKEFHFLRCVELVFSVAFFIDIG